MPKTISQTVVFKKTTPRQLYSALMDSKKHSVISQGKSQISKKVGEPFSASGGYIQGVNLNLVPDKQITQAWRGTNWPAGHYSVAIFEFEKQGKGAKLKFTQMSVPDDQYDSISDGWKQYYWDPLKEMFGETV